LDIRFTSLADIVEDPEQPRKQHSEESLRGLADSIRQHGLLNPITISPLEGTDSYRLITGERRWRAAKMANLEVIPCIVKQVGNDERLTEQLIENMQREDLQPLEKARAIQHVRSALNLTNREVAKRLGLAERNVGYLLDLLNLPEAIGETVVSSPNRPADGQVTEKHARFLKQLNDEPELQSAVVDRIREKKLSSDDTGNLVKALKKQPGKAKEILDSPTDHLVKFFQGSDPAGDFLDNLEVEDAPVRILPHAQRIIDMLPILNGMELGALSRTDLKQLEDALTSLRVTTDGLLKKVKQNLGE
jgi:ParB family transcriptional regulator, chromosome partitioning protein